MSQRFASRSFPAKVKFTLLSDEILLLALLLERERFYMDSKSVKTQMNGLTDAEITTRCARTRDWVQSKTVQWTATKINLNIFSLKESGVRDEAENSVVSVKLFGKNHWFLQLQDDGNVTGTREQGHLEGKVTRNFSSF